MTREIDFSDPYYVANICDCLDQRMAALEDKVEKYTSTNKASPKLPPIEAVYSHLFSGRFMFDPEDSEYKLVTDTYEYIRRQLQA